MDIYLTNEKTGEEFQFPNLPDIDSLKINGETMFQEYDLLQDGEIKFPRGNKLQTLSWEGTFYNQRKRGKLQFFKYQIDPIECVKKLEKWRNDGHRIRVLITETPINDRYDIESFEVTPTIMDEYKYSIRLSQGKDVVIEVVEGDKQVKPADRGPLDKETQKAKTKAKKNDNRFRAAKRATGDGSNYDQIKEDLKPGDDVFKAKVDKTVKEAMNINLSDTLKIGMGLKTTTNKATIPMKGANKPAKNMFRRRPKGPGGKTATMRESR